MDTIRYLLGNSVILLACFTMVFLALTVIVILWFRDFSEERRYIIMEMNRSGPKERAHWEKRLKRLYLSQIPVLGYFLCKKIK